MSETPVQTPVRRDRSAAARRAARLERAERAARIISLLNRGVSVAEIAACEGLSLKRMRNLVPEIPGEAHASAPGRVPRASSQPAQRSAARDLHAMHLSAAGTNFEGVDRVVGIVRALHGSSNARRRVDLRSIGQGLVKSGACLRKRRNEKGAKSLKTNNRVKTAKRNRS